MTVEEPVELVEEAGVLELCHLCEEFGHPFYPGRFSQLGQLKISRMKSQRLCRRMISKGYLEPTGKHVHTRGPWAEGLRLTQLGHVRRGNALEEIYASAVQVYGKETVDEAIRLGFRNFFVTPLGCQPRVVHKSA